MWLPLNLTTVFFTKTAYNESDLTKQSATYSEYQLKGALMHSVATMIIVKSRSERGVMLNKN